MLNLTAIEAAMRNLGLTRSALAELCGVSKEATSNWLNGESIPRPSKLSRLATALKIPVDSLLVLEEPVQPIFAYRTQRNRAVTGEIRDAGDDQARHLAQLLPFVSVPPDFEAPVLKNPSLDDAYIRRVASHARNSVGLSHKDILADERLEALFHNFGAIFVPVLWGLDKQRHENALTVYLPDSKVYWVVFNLGCRKDDYKYWLAHEYGHCLTMHHLNEEDGEIFAEKFAQQLVFPDEVAHDCLEAVRNSRNGLSILYEYAENYGVSVVTVLRAVDRLSEQLYGEKTGNDRKSFYALWKMKQKNIPTMAKELFDSDFPSKSEYIIKSEFRYKTPVFSAIRFFQESEGGRNPAFVSSVLGVELGDALSLSHELWDDRP